MCFFWVKNICWTMFYFRVWELLKPLNLMIRLFLMNHTMDCYLYGYNIIVHILMENGKGYIIQIYTYIWYNRYTYIDAIYINKTIYKKYVMWLELDFLDYKFYRYLFITASNFKLFYSILTIFWVLPYLLRIHNIYGDNKIESSFVKSERMNKKYSLSQNYNI